MRIKHFLITAMAALAVFTGCYNTVDEPVGNPDVSITSTDLSFEAEGGEAELQLTSGREWWVIKSSDQLSVNPMKGYATYKPVGIKIAVLENAGADSVYTVRFTNGLRDAVLTINQKGKSGGSAGGEVDPSSIIKVSDFLAKKDVNTEYTIKGTISGLRFQPAPKQGFGGFDLTDDSGKITCAFPANLDDYKDGKLKDGDIVTIKGKYNEHNGKGQMYQGTIIKVEDGSINPDPVPTPTDIIKVSDFLAKKDVNTEYTIKGTISGLRFQPAPKQGFGGFDLTDDSGKITCAFPANLDDYKDGKLKDGDIVTIKGKYNEHNGKAQMYQGTIIKVETGSINPDPTPVPTPTDIIKVSDFLAKKDVNTEYTIKGTISGLTFQPAPKQGFGGFDLTDDSGKITCAFPANLDDYKDGKLKDGDIVTIKGKYNEHKGKAQMYQGTIIKVETGSINPDPTPEPTPTPTPDEGGELKPVTDRFESNVTFTENNEAKSYRITCVIDGKSYEGFKLGSGKAEGTIDVTIPAGAKTLSFYAKAWSGKTSSLVVTVGGQPTEFKIVRAEGKTSGVNGNTFEGLVGSEYTEEDHFEVALNGATKVTFASKKDSDPRVLVIGLQATK